MGYRSEVAYRIVFDNEEVMKLFLAEAKSREDTKLVFRDMEEDEFEAIEILESEREIHFHVHGWKWYDDYDVVKNHTALLDLAKAYNEREDTEGNEIGDVHYAFARIGEDMEDNDTWGSDDYWELLDIERRITWG